MIVAWRDSSFLIVMSRVGYVIGTQVSKTVRLRVPQSIYLPKYKRSITKHQNYLAHDETDSCMVGDVIKITPIMAAPIGVDGKLKYVVCGMVKRAERWVCPDTRNVYTSGHLSIPVGKQELDGVIRNRITREEFREMGLI